MKKVIKELIKKIPFAQHAYRFFREPREELKRIRDYYAFRKEIHDTFQVDNGGGNGRLLVISLLDNWTEAVKEEAFLVKAIQLRKYDCFILTVRGCWANYYYRLFGLKNFVYFDDYLSSARKHAQVEDIDSILSSVNTLQDLLQLEYSDVKIGKYITSWVMRKNHSGEIDISDPEIHKYIKEHLHQSIVTIVAAKKIYECVKPDRTLFLERGYVPYGEFFDLSLKYGINAIQWCGSYRIDAYTLKRYTFQNADMHPGSISAKTWELMRSIKWTPQKREEVRKELFKQYESGSWFSRAGTQFKTRIVDKDEVIERLKLDPTKKTAVIFPHLFWDATFFWGKDIFDNYQVWFVETVKAACRNNNLNWVIKIHPANVVKLKWDGYKGKLVELQSIEQEIGELPQHVKILLPDSELSTYSLFSVMDYCVTVRGTIGIEAAFFGIPVFTAGTGRYDHFGFTIDSENKGEYLKKLSHIQEFPPLNDKQKELAEKFAFATFILRPFQVRNIKILQKKDEVATSNVSFKLRTKNEVIEAEDLNSLGDWAVNSTCEDYLDQGKLNQFANSEIEVL